MRHPFPLHTTVLKSIPNAVSMSNKYKCVCIQSQNTVQFIHFIKIKGYITWDLLICDVFNRWWWFMAIRPVAVVRMISNLNLERCCASCKSSPNADNDSRNNPPASVPPSPSNVMLHGRCPGAH
eukprot:391899_1